MSSSASIQGRWRARDFLVRVTSAGSQKTLVPCTLNPSLWFLDKTGDKTGSPARPPERLHVQTPVMLIKKTYKPIARWNRPNASSAVQNFGSAPPKRFHPPLCVGQHIVLPSSALMMRSCKVSLLLWCALALQLAAQFAFGGSLIPSTEELLRRELGGQLIPKLPICLAPEVTSPLTGSNPKSAVTTVQTGNNCGAHGDPPARVLSNLESPNGLQDYVQICHGQILSMTDKAGLKRAVCFYANPKSTKRKPLPLLVYLHPSLFGATTTFPLTGYDLVRDTQSLNNEDPSRLGFSYILPAGRNTVHQYPFPDQVGLGWDNWYRNSDRSSPELNIDVDFIDKSIAYAKSNVPVDPRRVFLTGWSNGAAMAELYAAQTDGIASAAVYSAPDPYRDSQDPCTQVPYPKFATPVRDVHNYCDFFGICTTGKYYHDDLKKRYPSLKQSMVVIDVLTAAVKSKDANAQCDPACQSACIVTTGTLAHLRWPVTRNSDTFFSFLRANPLPASGTWGAPR